MTKLVDQLITEHLDADPERRHAYLHDPQFHGHERLLRRALAECDEALAAAGRTDEYRRELLGVLLCGPPASAAASERIKDHAARVHELDRAMCPPLVVDGHDYSRGYAAPAVPLPNVSTKGFPHVSMTSE